MKKIFLWLDKNFEDVLCGVLLVAIMVMLMAQVAVRFFFGHGVTFSEELCRFAFLYLVYFAASLVASKGAHIRVTAHTKLMPNKVRIGFLVVSDLCWIVFNIVVIWQGTMLLDSMSTRPMLSGALLIDLRYVYFAVPAAFALQTFRIVQRWYRYIRHGVEVVANEQEV